MRSVPRKKATTAAASGKLRIGDNWNAITIIALSQSSPLKAVAEFVENSIDAKARNITIVRGKERGQMYLRITDDGTGIPLDDAGVPNFKYVATHVCDSIKRQLKKEGTTGIQGEYGIGLLSFWTVGEELTLISPAADGKAYSMRMVKGDPGYTIHKRRILFGQQGMELDVRPLLPGIKQLSGEKMQWYLASELRDRIRTSGVNIRIIDRHARKEFTVEPRRFTGRLLHELPTSSAPRGDIRGDSRGGIRGDIYTELYLEAHSTEHRVGLYRAGTRVLEDIASLDQFQAGPWNSGYLQSIVDAPSLTLTPGTRSGIIQDQHFEDFCAAMRPLETELAHIIDEQRNAEEERASRKILKSVQRALKEALLALPADEYDWFEIDMRDARDARRKQRDRKAQRGAGQGMAGPDKAGAEDDEQAGSAADAQQAQFFEIAGPLFSVRISPASCVVPVGGTRNLRAVARDRSGRLVEKDLHFRWEIVAGDGDLMTEGGEIATFTAAAEPGLVDLRVQVEQAGVVCEATGIITVTDSLLPETRKPSSSRQGLPGYTFHKAPGELWRSRYDSERNIIVINNGHRDFVYASRSRARKIRYICKLFAKELVRVNFPGASPEVLLERMVELSLYTEENLK